MTGRRVLSRRCLPPGSSRPHGRVLPGGPSFGPPVSLRGLTPSTPFAGWRYGSAMLDSVRGESKPESRAGLAVLVSSGGTNLRAILDAGLVVTVVVADRDCGALAVAAEAGVAGELVERGSFGADFDRDAYTDEVVSVLRRYSVDVVAMAGFGTILGRAIQDAFGGRVLNTHPALLPAFPGWHAVPEALAAGVAVTGCTVHLAELEVDRGPILAQEEVAVLPDDTEDSLHDRIKAVEHRLYPAAIRRFIDEMILVPETRQQGVEIE